MKRYLMLLLTLCCLLLAACSTSTAESAPDKETPPVSSANDAKEAPAQAENAQTPDPSASMDWGITLTVENATPGGLTIRCTQSGGNPTSELRTGSYYVLERKTETGWEVVEYAPQEYEIGWTDEAWIIPLNGDVTWDVDWIWLYGALPEGTYRIGKNIMAWRAPGDYDQQMAYAEFELPELLICDGLPLAPADIASN